MRRPHTSIFILNALLLLIFPQGCREKSKNKIPVRDSQPERAAITISYPEGDSLVLLSFSGLSLDSIQMPVLRLNGINTFYNLLSAQTLTLKSNTLIPGKNWLLFSYTRHNVPDSIEKEFCHTEKVSYSIVNAFKHESSHFTEGLLFDADWNLLESTGMENSSGIYRYRRSLRGFEIIQSIKNKDHEFGEGIAIYNEQLVQLLWKSQYLKIYNSKSLEHIKDLHYNSEGWGLCTGENTLYASNGSSGINILDINGNKAHILKTIYVTGEQGAVSNINELEFINGMLFANIWRSNFIYIIDPVTGYVSGSIDLTPIVEKETLLNPEIDLLNGIAYYKPGNTILITGKFWSNFYELKLSRPAFIGKEKAGPLL